MQAGSSNTLSAALLSQLALRGDAKWYARNELLIKEGAVSDSIYILLGGQLKVFTEDSKGRELVYNILQPGEFFGELFLDGGPRSASVKALSDSQCVRVDQLAMREFMSTYPEFAECLVHKLIERLRHATRLSKSLGLYGVYERTVDLLNEVAVSEGEVRLVPLTITQQEMADRVGATREMINHVVRSLISDGFLIRDEQKRLVFAKALPIHW